jgi:hypothetical protein
LDILEISKYGGSWKKQKNMANSTIKAAVK